MGIIAACASKIAMATTTAANGVLNLVDLWLGEFRAVLGNSAAEACRKSLGKLLSCYIFSCAFCARSIDRIAGHGSTQLPLGHCIT
jgi:hypothetical protein